MARNSFHKHPASGQIVVINIDDKSLHSLGNWPWPRRVDAKLVDALSAAGAKRIVFDINFSYRSNRVDDRAFADSIAHSGRVTLPSRFKAGAEEGTQLNSAPLPEFASHAEIAHPQCCLQLGKCGLEAALWRQVRRPDNPVLCGPHGRSEAGCRRTVSSRLFHGRPNRSPFLRGRRHRRPRSSREDRGQTGHRRSCQRRHRRCVLHSGLRPRLRRGRPCLGCGDAQVRYARRSRLGSEPPDRPCRRRAHHSLPTPLCSLRDLRRRTRNVAGCAHLPGNRSWFSST